MYFFAALAAMVLLNLFLPLTVLIPYPWNAAGLIPLAAGIALNLSADRALKRNGTTVRPFEPSTALVTTGVYKYSRNPMYLGMILTVAGAAFLLGALSPFIIVPAFAITMNRVFVVTEETMLAERFGDKWRVYKADVRRWF